MQASYPLLAASILLFTLVASAVAGVTYQYDAAGRLTRATYENGASISYTYDAHGNLLSKAFRSALGCGGAFAVSTGCQAPNHAFTVVQVGGVTDPDGQPAAITVTGVTQDEAVGAKGSGNTCPDALLVDTDGDGEPDAAAVRCERAGKGNGRVYTIHFTARQPAGGECTGSVEFCVPHDRSSPACTGDGQLFDSFTCPGDGGGGALSRPRMERLFLRADADSDGAVDLADVSFLLRYLAAGGARPRCEDAADANDDGSVNLPDVIYTLAFLYSGGASVPAPYPETGLDPTSDGLRCGE
jgi:YD repeat-containing protein